MCWSNSLLFTQLLLLCVLSTIVLPIDAQNQIHNIRSHFQRHDQDKQPKIQIVQVNDVLFERFDPNRRVRRDLAGKDKELLLRELEVNRDRVRRDLNEEDREFARGLRELFRDTRGTYGRTELMNREHTTKLKKMFVMQDPQLMAHAVDSEQVQQLIMSSEERKRGGGTRLPLWGIPMPKDIPSTTTSNILRDLRELFQDTRGTFGRTQLMNREHTTKVKKMFVEEHPDIMEYGVNSEQFEEIIKASKERGSTKFPLIGITRPNVTFSTKAIDFIRELRALFRDTRATFAHPTKIMNQANVTSKKSQLKAGMDPEVAPYVVGSHQVAEIIKSSEERARGNKTFPLIGMY
ncbi:hypothetical protein WDU94_007092 [Cyamophila willieti]